MRVIGIGDNVCDKYEHLRLMFPGGQAANFAVYAGMLGAESAYMGVFKRDEVAEHVIATLDELQVEHSRCRQYEGENGYARVTLVDGDRVFLGSNKGGVLKENPLNLDVEDLGILKHLIMCTRPIIAILMNSFLNWQNRESLYRMIFRVSGSMKNE